MRTPTAALLIALLLPAGPVAAELTTRATVMRAEWAQLCEQHDVAICPRLLIRRKYLSHGWREGLLRCGYGHRPDGSKVRACFEVEAYTRSPDALVHEMAHVLRWLAGDDVLDHGPDFKATYKLLTE